MFSFLKRGPGIDGLSCIELGSEGFSLAHVVRDDALHPHLQVCEYRTFEDPSKIGETVAAAVAEFGLEGADCVSVLRPGDYSLRLVDVPDVPAEELVEAARFSVMDLVDFDIEDAVIDTFRIPGQDQGDLARTMYVVAAPNVAIQQVVDLVSEAGLNLTAIDIRELALRNVCSLLPEDAKGMAMLSLWDESGLVTLSREGKLCVARDIVAGLARFQDIGGDDSLGEKQSLSADGQDALEGMLLEVQRSLDYYEHQLGQGRVASLVIAPLTTEIPMLLTYLAQNLSLRIRVLDLNEILEWDLV